MKDNELVSIPVFINDLFEARELVTAATLDFLATNPKHEVCDSMRKQVVVDVESDILPNSDAEYGYKPILHVSEVMAMQCECPVILSAEEESDQHNKLVELAPNGWNVIKDMYLQENKNTVFALDKPTVGNAKSIN